MTLGPITGAGASAATSEPSFGHSFAQTLQLDPRTAGLSYAVTFGAALADHTNNVARAQAQMVNFGVIGTAATTASCPNSEPPIDPKYLPKPTRVDSREPGAEDGKTTKNGPFEEDARASSRPFADAASTIAPLDLAGVITFANSKAESTSGVDTAGRTIATGQVDVGSVSLVNGLVKLEGLHWRSASEPGKADPSSKFWIDRVAIAGVPVPQSDAFATLDRVNTALAPLGLVVSLPKIHTDNDTTFVDPLRIGIVPSATRDQLARPVINGAQPVRQAVFQYLLDHTPCAYSPASIILVADVLTLAATGGGSMNVNIGGTQAQTKDLPPVTGFDFAAGAAPRTNVSAADIATTPPPAEFVSPPALYLGDAPKEPPGRTRAALPAVRTKPADNAWWVALAVIGLGAVLVEGELRLRRRREVAS